MGEIEQSKDHILDLFLNRYWSANMIAEELGVSRQGVVLALQGWGVETAKAVAGWVEVACGWEKCGRRYKVPRSKARKYKEEGLRHFCGRDCYQKYMRKLFG